MKIFKTQEYINLKNPTPTLPYRPEILTAENGAKDVGGIFGLLTPGSQVPYHFHKRRESVLIVISGQGIEMVEGKEIPIAAGDVLYIPPGEKHAAINRSKEDLRYLEFFTCPPTFADLVEVEDDNANDK